MRSFFGLCLKKMFTIVNRVPSNNLFTIVNSPAHSSTVIARRFSLNATVRSSRSMRSPCGAM